MAVDWFADPLTWTGFLRAHGVQLRTGDDLRLMLLLDQLPTQGIALPDATAVARWVGPVLCNNADQQADLEGLLTSFAALVEPLPQASVSVGTPEVERALNPHEPWWWWVSIVVLVGLAILPIATFWTSSLGLMSLESSAGLDKAIFPRGTSFSVAGALSFLSVVCILLLGIVLVAARRWRRAFLLRGVAPRDARQSGFGIPVVDLPLFRREALRPIFADLRRHRMVPGYGIDVPASIAATVAAAGFATLAPMQRRAQPDHLLLVDLAGRDDHMSVLAELLMARARAEDVAIERFDFRGDARYLQAVNGHDAGQFAFTDLQTLYARCPDHRLLILSDSAVLVDSASESLRDWGR